MTTTSKTTTSSATTGNPSSDTHRPLLSRTKFGLQSKLITIFTIVKVIPLIILAVLAWIQIVNFGGALSSRAIEDASLERYSVLRSIAAIKRCDVAILMIDALDGVTDQDAKIAMELL